MLSVHQFVGHLDLESQGAVLVSKDAFLSFLREQYRGTSDLEAQAKRDLEQAAREQVNGKRLEVAALPDEREAAKAVLYAVMRLADKFKAQAPENAEISSAREYTDQYSKLKGAKPQKRWKAGYNGAGGWATHDDLYPRMPFVLTFTVNGRETARLCVWENKLETTLEDVRKGQGFSRRYVAAIAASAIPGGRLTWQVSHPKAESLARRMLLEAQRLAKRCPKLSAGPRLDDPPKVEPPREVRLPILESHTETLEVGERCTSTPEAARRGTPGSQSMVRRSHGFAAGERLIQNLGLIRCVIAFVAARFLEFRNPEALGSWHGTRFGRSNSATGFRAGVANAWLGAALGRVRFGCVARRTVR
jgi:hypothetical protein